MKRIIIDRADVTRTALVENGKLVELLTDDPAAASVIGTIYAGTVQNVTKSGFAFIDVGLARTAFLFLSDPRENGVRLKNGRPILVQALKDPSGDKGAYVTSRLSLTGRFVVVERSPNFDSVSVSKKIAGDDRERLKRLLSGRRKGFSAIVRTDATGAEDSAVLAEFDRLSETLALADSEWTYAKPPCVVHGGGDSAVRTFYELYRRDVDEVVVNDAALYQRLRAEAAALPEPRPIVTLHADGLHIFDAYSVATAISKLRERKVWLDSGAFLVIDKTEACVVIDVNSGKAAPKADHAKTALSVNLEAAKEIARQIRLRNLAGIIIVDFIDMQNADHVTQLTEALAAATAKDRVPVAVVGMTELGLMQMTRKKTRG